MAILHVLRHLDRHLSSRKVFKQAKKDFPGLTEPTVYRTLELLAKNHLSRPALDEGLIVADGATKEILADKKFFNQHGLEKT